MKKLFTQYAGLKKEIYILFAGQLVTAMGSFVWPMLTFFLTTKLGLSDGRTTLLIAAATTVMLPMVLLGGKLADRYSRKNIIIVFDLLTVFFYVLASLLPISFRSAVVIFFAGLFQTLERPAYDALIADFSTTAQREKAMSLSYLGFNLGFIVGASLAGVLFAEHTNLAFLINGLAIFCSTVLIFFFVDPANAITESEVMEEQYSEYEMPLCDDMKVIDVLRDRKVIFAMILIGCFASMPSTIVGVLLPLQLKEAMGEYGARIYGYLSSLNGFTVILFTPLLTMLLRRITEIPKNTMGMLLFVSGMVLFMLGAPVWILFLGMFIYTQGEVTSVLGNNPYTSRRVPASHRGRVGGISSLIYSLFGSAVQFGISFILTATESNYRLIWILFILCGLTAAMLYGLMYRFDKKRFPILYENKL